MLHAARPAVEIIRLSITHWSHSVMVSGVGGVHGPGPTVGNMRISSVQTPSAGFLLSFGLNAGISRT